VNDGWAKTPTENNNAPTAPQLHRPSDRKRTRQPALIRETVEIIRFMAAKVGFICAG
jgi:hypothetical protein